MPPRPIHQCANLLAMLQIGFRLRYLNGSLGLPLGDQAKDHQQPEHQDDTEESRQRPPAPGHVVLAWSLSSPIAIHPHAFA